MNLQLFLSDRCNLGCDYCWLALNQGPAVVLGEEAARKAVRDHLARFGRGAQITLLGGEPLIHADLARAILKEVKRRAPVSIATNGTRACPEALKELSDLGASLVLSLDGAPESHDAHRPLLGSRESSHEAVMKALESSDVPLRVNMVVTAATAPALPRNAEWLRAHGFRRLSFHPHVLEKWTPKSLETLRAALEGFARYYRALPRGALELTHLPGVVHATVSPDGNVDNGLLSSEHGDEDVILGADGAYYPCDGLFAKPYKELQAWAGDYDKAARLKAEARDKIHSILKGAAHYTCPREPYFHALATGGDPEEAVLRFHRADTIFGEALARLARPREAARGL